jgi:exopolysaccharide biosynthesis predicted pyruvyltransferase EpsI
MSRVIFSNVNYFGNAGDYWSSPLHYYNFSNIDFEHVNFLNLKDNPIKDKVVVIGGGGLIITKTNYLNQILESIVENNKTIFWGVGSNTSCVPYYDILSHPNVLLVGTRDIELSFNHRYLPCVSCKNILFDKSRVESGGIGLIEHPDYPINIPDLPKITNSSKIDEILDFIFDKSIIISSTFHGVYWSQLMNKKVLYFNNTNEINSKFLNLKHRIPICNKEDYKEKIYNLSKVTGLLEESRYLNDNFYKDVISIL